MKKIHIEFMFCHQKPERSFFWGGKQFPVCARCTGIHIGYLSMPLFLFGVTYLNFWISIAIILPTIIDGITQAILKRESNNFLRATSGFLAGIGTMSIVSIFGKFVGAQLLLLYQTFL